MPHPLRGKIACVGLATAGCGEAPGWNAMELMVQAVHGALADAQIPLSQVDGLFAATAFHSMPAMSLAEHLGIQPSYSDGSNIGGSSFMAHALTAAMAIEMGLCNVAVIAYGSHQRSAGGFKSISEAMPYEAIYEPRNPVNAYALAASRYMYQFGATREHLAEVAVAARGWARLNPEAFSRDPLTVADVLKRAHDLRPARQARLLPCHRWRGRDCHDAGRPREGWAENAGLSSWRGHGAPSSDGFGDAGHQRDSGDQKRAARVRDGGL